MRTPVDWRSSSPTNYKNFCKKNPTIKISVDEWRTIIYEFNEYFKNYILETGEKVKAPFGFGEFSINKKKRKKLVEIVKDTIVHQITNDKSKSRLEFFEEASVKEETDSEVSEKMNYIKTKN